jgi:hypothetical protein
MFLTWLNNLLMGASPSSGLVAPYTVADPDAARLISLSIRTGSFAEIDPDAALGVLLAARTPAFAEIDPDAAVIIPI